MSNQEESKKEDTSYVDIGFIDPEDLISFIPEEPTEPSKETAEFVSKLEDVIENPEKYVRVSKEFEDNIHAYVSKKQEDTRGRLAIIYTIFTFVIFLLGFVVAVLDAQNSGRSIIDNLQIILPLLSGIFLGTLGFVIGYYFRKSEE